MIWNDTEQDDLSKGSLVTLTYGRSGVMTALFTGVSVV